MKVIIKCKLIQQGTSSVLIVPAAFVDTYNLQISKKYLIELETEPIDQK